MYLGSGADFTGVPTKMLNMNGSLRFSVYNPATFYGIHVSATPVNLVYLDVVVATGQVIYDILFVVLRNAAELIVLMSVLCRLFSSQNDQLSCMAP